jgi:50S ribosomal protein L16 3-hydroxylase
LNTIDLGVDAREFRERVFEQECRLARGALTLERPFTIADVEPLIARVDPMAPELELHHHGPIPEYAFTQWEPAPDGVPRRRLDARFRTWLAEGATLVLNGAERHSRRIAALCAAVERFVGFPTRANAYFSCGGDGSFGAHWDTHDVVVAQLVGAKRWKIYPPTFPLPLPMHTSRESSHRCPGTPVLDIELSPGDVLYLPRGFWHDVRPNPEPSLHVSIGIYPPSVLDVFAWMCTRLLAEQLCARRTALDDAATTRDLAELVRTLEHGIAQPQMLQRFRTEGSDPRTG